MTSQEQQMLQGLIARVNQTQVTEKDSDAEQMLGASLGRNPDALYILAQTVLVQGYGLEQAQKQLADARQQVDDLQQQLAQQQAQPKHTSFLGSLLGRDEPAPPPAVPAQYQQVPGYPQGGPQGGYQPGYGQSGYGQPYPPAGYGAPGYGAPAGGGGFLRGAMQTAAGVAAGALAFEGVESLFHGFGHAAGYGSEFAPMGGGFGGGPREEVINNYYGDAAPGHEHGGQADNLSGFDTPATRDAAGHDAGSGDSASGFDSPSPNFMDPNNSGFDDSTANADDLQGFDDLRSGDDSGSGDDSSGFDDSASFDSGDSGGGFDSGGGDGF
jgi:hypothetical protein